ncbi:F-box/LRR-repeat protein 6-like isoform X2 [Sceloporus undulatus]|uniref:F-box/LRR-repeat protein 6-like isoform X2 n=1 Tax=Sceloporus undulatus TaxID=8520 RepID=UPI001C4BD39A|nr:F-box/LRR-repeat protein 6-like isoform X2 [Sceloporus undulatus]
MDEEEPRGSRGSPGSPPAACSRSRAPRKRKREVSGNAESAGQIPKEKRRKKSHRAPRTAAPHYFVHETDNDMLLIISNVGEAPERPLRKTLKKKKRKPIQRQWKSPKKRPTKQGKSTKGKTLASQRGTAGVLGEGSKSLPIAPQSGTESSWGEHLPVEILVQIFQVVVALDGAVPFLCRVSRVCRLWCGAASSPVLWQKVSVGHCWVAPGKKLPPAAEKKVLITMEWLVANRFSHLREFSLCHWKSQVPFVLKAIGHSCPLLASLKLSHCSGVTTESLCTLAESCQQLESLNLQNSQMDASAVLSFLEAAGSRIRHLWLTYSSRMSAIIGVLLNGSCPELQLLEVNTEIKQSTQHFQLPIEQLQAACPKLQVLRLLNVICYPKSIPSSAPQSPGFPQLEELCLATTSFSFVDNNMLRRILCASTKLRVLDLRGCFRVTPKGLELLPCPDLEQLYLGLYCSAIHLHLPLEGCPLITWKWSHSLRELDLTGQSFNEHDLEEGMAAFCQKEGTRGEPALRSLSLTGTKITHRTISSLIASCPALNYLNLSSCRHLPRGMKKVYRGRDEIRQCLRQLLASSEESAGPEGTT